MAYGDRIDKIRHALSVDSNRGLEKVLQLSNGYINNIESGDSTNPGKLIAALVTNGISADWFLTGAGSMFLYGDNGDSESHSTTSPKIPRYNEEEIEATDFHRSDKCPKHGVPYHEIDVAAHISEMLDTTTRDPEYYVDFEPFNDCTAYLPVYGDSMYPMIKSGDLIAVKKITNLDGLLWGEAYMVITNSDFNNLRTVKLVYPHEDPKCIIIRASNPNFKGDTIVPKETIINMFIIKGIITRKQM